MWKLLRLKDFLNFTISVTLLGYAVALHTSGLPVNWFKLLLVVFANIFAVAFAFVINELEDAEDDGKKIDIALARNLSIFTFIVSFVLYLFLGKSTFVFGFLILILGFLYSWKKVRLKSYPIVDILSHCLMLGAFIFLAGYFNQGQFLGKAIFLGLAVTFASAYGQFYNQVRDFKADKEAGLKNTSILLGRRAAAYLMYSCLILMIALIFYSFYLQILPLWFIPTGIVAGVLSILFLKTNLAERDRRSGVATVNFHSHFLLILGVLSLIYLIA